MKKLTKSMDVLKTAAGISQDFYNKPLVYFNELQRSELLKEIKEFFNYSNYSQNSNMSLEDLEIIKKIIEKY